MEPFFGRCGREIHSSDVRSAFSGCQAGIASLVGAFSEALNQTGSCVSSSAFAVNWAQTYSGLFATCKYTQVILYPRSQFNSGLMISRESWNTISVTLIRGGFQTGLWRVSPQVLFELSSATSCDISDWRGMITIYRQLVMLKRWYGQLIISLCRRDAMW